MTLQVLVTGVGMIPFLKPGKSDPYQIMGARDPAGARGCRPALFAKVAVKARKHAEHNDKVIFREQVTVEQVLASPVIFGPMSQS